MRSACLAVILGLLCAAPAEATVKGSTYEGFLALSGGQAQTEVSISFRANSTLSLTLNEGSSEGTYSERDLLLFSRWSGEIDGSTAEVSGIGILGVVTLLTYTDGAESGTGVLYRTGPEQDPQTKGVLGKNDITYLGAYRIPRQPIAGAGDESIYGNGLTLRRESSDTTNPVHLLSAAYGSNPNHRVYEWRDTTPGTGGSNPHNLDNYPAATVVKTYGNIYSGKKLIIYNGVEGPMTGQLDGDFGLHWDEEDQRLYWSYGFGYSHDGDSWCLGYSTLDYANNTGTGYGPWRFAGQSWKAMMGGFVGIPKSFAVEHFAGKRLAIGMGGYYSIVAACDCSLGPSLTAFDPIDAAEKTSLPSTPLVGYWSYQSSPGAGTGHANRPEPRLSSNYDVDNWGVDKFSWNDRVRGGCWVETSTKRGVLFVGTYGKDYTQYLSSQIPSSKHGHFWAIYDPNEFTPVSGKARYEIQPASIYEMHYPTIDYSQVNYAGGEQKPVAAITSLAGSAVSSNSGCIVSCAAHGYSESKYVEIRGASLTEFNGIWEIPPGGVIDANSFYIRNTSSSLNWSGSSPSGQVTVQRVANYVDRPLGATFDPATNRLYVAVSVARGTNNLNGHVMVHVYQVAGDPAGLQRKSAGDRRTDRQNPQKQPVSARRR